MTPEHHSISHPDNSSGLNGSLQHSLAVYWPESQTPKSFEDVDLTAARLCRVQLVYSRTSPSVDSMGHRNTGSKSGKRSLKSYIRARALIHTESTVLFRFN